jgi:hypothetical protein
MEDNAPKPPKRERQTDVDEQTNLISQEQLQGLVAEPHQWLLPEATQGLPLIHQTISLGANETAMEKAREIAQQLQVRLQCGVNVYRWW